MYNEPSVHARLDIPNIGAKTCEVAIIGNVLRENIHLQWLDLSKNYVDALGLKILVEHLRNAPFVRYLNLSNNPLTNNGKDMSGIEDLVLFSRTHTSLCSVKLEKIYPDTPDLRYPKLCSVKNKSIKYYPYDSHYNCRFFSPIKMIYASTRRNLIKKMERSCSVNRSVRLSKDVTKERQRDPHEEDQSPIYEEFFESYIIHKLFSNAPPPPVDPLKTWYPKDTIDKGTLFTFTAITIII